MRQKYNKERIQVLPADLWRLRGELMARRRCRTDWTDFCNITGIPRTMLSKILMGERNAGPVTVGRLFRLREHGIVVHLSDFPINRVPPKD